MFLNAADITLRVLCPFSTKVRASTFRNRKQNEVLLFLRSTMSTMDTLERPHLKVENYLSKEYRVTQIVLKGWVSEPDK